MFPWHKNSIKLYDPHEAFNCSTKNIPWEKKNNKIKTYYDFLQKRKKKKTSIWNWNCTKKDVDQYKEAIKENPMKGETNTDHK